MAWLQVFFSSVVDLHVINRAVLRPSADQVDVAVVIHANHCAIHRHRDVLRTVPAMVVGYIGVHVGNCHFLALPVHDVAAE